MGHSRIGTLPATKRWKEVVRLVANGADEAKVGEAVLQASGGTFAPVRDDAGFQAAFRLITELALAGGKKNPAGELAAAGVEIPQDTSLVETAVVTG